MLELLGSIEYTLSSAGDNLGKLSTYRSSFKNYNLATLLHNGLLMAAAMVFDCNRRSKVI